MNNVQAVKKVLFEVFGDLVSEKTINASVFSGKSDPGQWSSQAKVVVHTENGIPHPLNYDSSTIYEKWEEVNKKLQALGKNLYHEYVNGAVIAFYEGF